MKYYTYIHYTRDTNEPFYIGHGFDRRWKQLSPRSEEWQEIVMEHGFRSEIISHFETKKEAANHETQLILQYSVPGNILVNKSSGGVGGTTGIRQSAELVERRVGQQRGKDRPASTGANNGRFKGVTIATHCVTGEQLTFNGTKEITAAGFTWSAVSRCINGDRPRHKNYTWTRLNTTSQP